MSPSGEKMAATNLRDGVDWYSTSRGAHISTTNLGISRDPEWINMIVDLVFVDEDTVAVAHTSGRIVYVTFGMPEPIVTMGHGGEVPDQS